MDTEAVTMLAFSNLLMEIHDLTQNRVKDCFTNYFMNNEQQLSSLCKSASKFN